MNHVRLTHKESGDCAIPRSVLECCTFRPEYSIKGYTGNTVITTDKGPVAVVKETTDQILALLGEGQQAEEWPTYCDCCGKEFKHGDSCGRCGPMSSELKQWRDAAVESAWRLERTMTAIKNYLPEKDHKYLVGFYNDSIVESETVIERVRVMNGDIDAPPEPCKVDGVLQLAKELMEQMEYVDPNFFNEDYWSATKDRMMARKAHALKSALSGTIAREGE